MRQTTRAMRFVKHEMRRHISDNLAETIALDPGVDHVGHWIARRVDGTLEYKAAELRSSVVRAMINTISGESELMRNLVFDFASQVDWLHIIKVFSE